MINYLPLQCLKAGLINFMISIFPSVISKFQSWTHDLNECFWRKQVLGIICFSTVELLLVLILAKGDLQSMLWIKEYVFVNGVLLIST